MKESAFEAGDLVKLNDSSTVGIVLELMDKQDPSYNSEEMYRIMYNDGDWGIYFGNELARVE